MRKILSIIKAWLSQRQVTLAGFGQTLVIFLARRGFWCLGIVLMVSSAILPIAIYRGTCRYEVSSIGILDALLSLFFAQSGLTSCIQVSHEKTVQLLRDFPPIYAIVLAFQAAGLVPVLTSSNCSHRAVLFGLLSSVVFISGLIINLYWILEASYAGISVARWQFSLLISLLILGTAFTFLLLHQITLSRAE